jgi:hypothetical protein
MGSGSIAEAQSTNISAPAAVRTNEVLGTITARDIGDSRLTDHYYVFSGRPGDLLITVESKNLNGDVDVFTTSGLRPLLKFTVYSGNSSPATKSIYLRKQESLILRIEGRTPNDEEATYRLYFGGSFEPITTEPLVAENASAPIEPTPGAKPAKKGRRVSSVGARIEEPPTAEVAAAPTPAPNPADQPKPAEAKTEKSKTEPARAEVTKAEAPKAPARNPRGRRLPGRRTPAPSPPKEEPAKSDTENKPPAENAETTAPPSETKKRPAGRSTTARSVAKPVAKEPEPESGPRLMIETSDGTLINRYMSSVRRVVVENGQVVVTGKDGKIERVALASVVRMSIAP